MIPVTNLAQLMLDAYTSLQGSDFTQCSVEESHYISGSFKTTFNDICALHPSMGALYERLVKGPKAVKKIRVEFNVVIQSLRASGLHWRGGGIACPTDTLLFFQKIDKLWLHTNTPKATFRGVQYRAELKDGAQFVLSSFVDNKIVSQAWMEEQWPGCVERIKLASQLGFSDMECVSCLVPDIDRSLDVDLNGADNLSQGLG